MCNLMFCNNNDFIFMLNTKWIESEVINLGW